jgi:hypothetical protein
MMPCCVAVWVAAGRSVSAEGEACGHGHVTHTIVRNDAEEGGGGHVAGASCQAHTAMIHVHVVHQDQVRPTLSKGFLLVPSLDRDAGPAEGHLVEGNAALAAAAAPCSDSPFSWPRQVCVCCCGVVSCCGDSQDDTPAVEEGGGVGGLHTHDAPEPGSGAEAQVWLMWRLPWNEA